MQVYRIAARQYAGDLSGAGARLYGGRWNPPGLPVLYAAESVPLAVLETLVNLPADFLSSGLCCRVTITFPDAEPIAEIAPGELPPDWYSYPAPAALAEIGRQWLARGDFLALRVPSAVAGGEGWNILLNPRHPRFDQVQVTDISPFQFDARLFQPNDPHQT
jgi:RES domain-containing protein